MSGIKLRILSNPAPCLVTVLTELPRLMGKEQSDQKQEAGKAIGQTDNSVERRVETLANSKATTSDKRHFKHRLRRTR